MISLDLTKSLEVRIAGDQPKYTYLIAKKSAYLFKFQKDDKVCWWDWLKFSKVTYYIHTRPHRMTMYIKLKFLFWQLEHFIYNIVIEARH